MFVRIKSEHSINLLLLFLTFLVCIVAFIAILDDRLKLDDDTLFFYFSQFHVTDKSSTEPIVQHTINILKESDKVTQKSSFRWQLRQDYLDNYKIASTLYFTSNYLFTGLLPNSNDNFPQYLVESMKLMLAFTFLFCLSILIVGFIYLNDWRYNFALLISVVTLTLFDIDFARGSQGLVEFEHIFDVSYNFAKFLFNPGYGLSLAGFAARCNLILLSILIFALRWKQHHALSYLLLLFLILYHNSMGGLLAAFVFITDIVLRPDIFKRPAVAIVAISSVLVFLNNEVLWSLTSLPHQFAGNYILSILIILITLSIITALYHYKGIIKIYHSYRKFLKTKNDITLDIFVIVLILIFSLPITYIINLYVSEYSSTHFWSVVSGRSIGILRAPVLFGLILLALNSMRPRWDIFKLNHQFLSISLVIACIAITTDIYDIGNNTRSNIITAYDLDLKLNTPMQQFSNQDDEALLSYALCKTYITKEDHYTRLIQDL